MDGDAIFGPTENRMLLVEAMQCSAARARSPLVAGGRLVGAEIRTADTLQRIAADRRQVTDLRRSGFEDRLRKDWVGGTDERVLSCVVQLRQRADADAPTLQGFDTFHAGNACNVDDPRRLDDADPRPVEKLGPTSDHHRVRQTGESNRISARGRPRIAEIAHHTFSPAAASTAAAI